MKIFQLLFLLMMLCAVYACQNNKGKSAVDKAPATINSPQNRLKNVKSPVDKSILQKLISLPTIKLPFGSKYLLTAKLPKNWVETIDEKGNIIPPTYERKMTKIVRSYDSLYHAKAITLPQLSAATYLNIITHNDSLFLHDIQKFKFKCDYKYRLPNFGPYECYYQSLKLTNDYNDLFVIGKRYTDDYYLEYGNLLFYNPKTGRANILNIYYTSSGSERYGSDYKWFYIDRDQKILIYKAGSDEGGGYFSLSQIVTISEEKVIIADSNHLPRLNNYR